jgi:hypothetical protein
MPPSVTTGDSQMIEEQTVKSKSSYYAFMFFILAFVGFLIFAGLFVKAKFDSGAQPKPTAAAKAPVTSSIAGRYIGFTTISTGICSLGAHEFVLEIDEDGNARSNYGMKPDKLMSGRINPEGRIKLSFRDGGQVIAFEGELRPGHIIGHSSVTGDKTCDISWDLWLG